MSDRENGFSRGDGSPKVKLAKSITTLGFFGLGLSAVFGASWLLTSGVWLDRAGGPENALIAFVLCFIVELPLILAYYEAVPMMPLAGGEMSYSYVTFGGFVGMIVGWFGVLVNIILCAWEALAISRLLSYLFQELGRRAFSMKSWVRPLPCRRLSSALPSSQQYSSSSIGAHGFPLLLERCSPL